MKWIDRRSELDKEMDEVINTMRHLDPTSEDYKKAAEAYKILSEAKKNNASTKISKDAIFSGVISIVQFSTGMLLASNGTIIWSQVKDTWHRFKFREN